MLAVSPEAAYTADGDRNRILNVEKNIVKASRRGAFFSVELNREISSFVNLTFFYADENFLKQSHTTKKL